MTVKPWINVGESEYSNVFDIKKVEEIRNAKYVGDFCIKTPNGNWSDMPVAVFYQETPPEGYGHYFGLFTRNGSPLICDASSTVGIPIAAVQADDGEIIYSRFRHDFRTSRDGTVSIDGGRDYTKVMGKFSSLILTIEDGEVVVVEKPDLLFVTNKLKEE